MEVKEGLVKLGSNRCRNRDYVIIPYSNDRQNITGGWLISTSTGVPTENDTGGKRDRDYIIGTG